MFLLARLLPLALLWSVVTSRSFPGRPIVGLLHPRQDSLDTIIPESCLPNCPDQSQFDDCSLDITSCCDDSFAELVLSCYNCIAATEQFVDVDELQQSLDQIFVDCEAIQLPIDAQTMDGQDNHRVLPPVSPEVAEDGDESFGPDLTSELSAIISPTSSTTSSSSSFSTSSSKSSSTTAASTHSSGSAPTPATATPGSVTPSTTTASSPTENAGFRLRIDTGVFDCFAGLVLVGMLI
ncbi:hypothetical protein VKT23_002609 [Stygiomarasmius scandens]|uniref:Extracellular membrane protein CFEM domain-containing protein n=1 Tax=Marasmiellus scandens TaxID=2682957 RepID=A0ABR1K588_9AGAR